MNASPCRGLWNSVGVVVGADVAAAIDTVVQLPCGGGKQGGGGSSHDTRMERMVVLCLDTANGGEPKAPHTLFVSTAVAHFTPTPTPEARGVIFLAGSILFPPQH